VREFSPARCGRYKKRPDESIGRDLCRMSHFAKVSGNNENGETRVRIYLYKGEVLSPLYSTVLF